MHQPAEELVSEWIRPAIRAIPRSIAARLPPCDITLREHLGEEDPASQWTLTDTALHITVSTKDVEPHDVAIEVLICVGQALWELVPPATCAEWVEVLRDEISASVTGEIDEQALNEKQKLLSSAASARSRRRLIEYARAAFAATVAEYVHCLWHDVTVRTGPGHLPPDPLRKRLELMNRWFPPNRGYRLFPQA